MVMLIILIGMVLHSNSKGIAIAIDQLINALLWGYADETLSARVWRNRELNKGWARALAIINCIFFWQQNHCKSAYESELERKHLPKEYRVKK